MNNQQIAAEIKQAFIEGYNSYATPENAYNTEESAWDESQAKKIHDQLLSANAELRDRPEAPR